MVPASAVGQTVAESLVICRWGDGREPTENSASTVIIFSPKNNADKSLPNNKVKKKWNEWQMTVVRATSRRAYNSASGHRNAIVRRRLGKGNVHSERELQRSAFPPQRTSASVPPPERPKSPQSLPDPIRWRQAAESPQVQRPLEPDYSMNQQLSNYSPFHSPLIDPVGSIVGLRLLYVDGKLAYVPVEPQINYLINQQFAFSNHKPPITQQSTGILPPWVLDPYRESYARDFYNNNNQVIHKQNTFSTVSSTSDSSQGTSTDSRIQPDYHYQPQTQPQQNQQRMVEPEPVLQAKSHHGSMPNLTKNSVLSSQEQHKLELQMQIEENKRRKQLEKQKEIEEEQREIRKWEEYQARLQREEQMEKEKSREKAQALERRSQQIYQEQQEELRLSKLAKQRAAAPPRPPSQEFMEKPPSRPDSAEPRGLEWWEKKPTWQQKLIDERKSAVIPTHRGKPPVPSSGRSRTASRHSKQAYDPSSSVQEHQSAANSRAPSPVAHPEEP
ncbi:unnamed protein product [Caenorhabditis auriculariae]|uniref:Uncharacterized protein n=1 Tax=Caenorhabditis auriculariae TaxID=2777116 RepID=A0A8S1HN55_9PELO|nr:unnamed protein product [Caenorhabditis auriculariae]